MFDGSEYGPDYLTFDQGAILELLSHEEADTDWAYGSSDKQVGWFPHRYFVPADPASTGGTANVLETLDV